MELIYTALQWTIFAMGLVAVGLSFYFIAFFRKSRSHRSLSNTMQLFLVEQVVCAAGTLTFSATSLWSTLTGEDFLLWNNMPPAVAIAIRAAMFGAMIISTAKLSNEVSKIAQAQSDREYEES